MSKSTKLTIGILIVVWMMCGIALSVINTPDEREGDNRVPTYPQEFYDTTK